MLLGNPNFTQEVLFRVLRTYTPGLFEGLAVPYHAQRLLRRGPQEAAPYRGMSKTRDSRHSFCSGPPCLIRTAS